MKVLLLTGTIRPLVNIKYKDPEIRLQEYTRTIQKYLENTDFDVIVFAENSGYAFLKTARKLDQLAKSKNKSFEYLDLSQCADNRNMSTGEAVLMRSALKESKLLQKADYIWKSTGRVFIRNANKIIQGKQKKDNVFLYSRACDSIQTWFFGINKCDLEKLLSDEVIDEMSRGCIEYAWMSYYRQHGDTMKITSFQCYPDAEGVNSSGVSYTLSPIKLALKNVLLKFGWFTVR